MKKIFLLIMCVIGCSALLLPDDAEGAGRPATQEIYYQVMVRSFYDSNGDGIGDLKGLQSRLDYLQDLGITAVWIMPVFASPAYFNYYADDFYKVDPTLGTLEDFRSLCRDVHRRGMKILLDMETQYITKRHEWFVDAEKDQQSRYGDFIAWVDREENIPQAAFGGFTENYSYDGVRTGIMSLNLNNPAVLEYQKKLYAYWLDPDRDGDLSDGVDGYRMDHLMDDLENAGFATNLLSSFWAPIVKYTKRVNPDVFYVVEPNNWGVRWDTTLYATGMDSAFNMMLRGAIVNMAKDSIIDNGITSLQTAGKGKYSFTIIENHDNNRFASEAPSNPDALKLGAFLNLTLPGVPCLYYGQELGSKGEFIKGMDDGNDIPRREAFRWFKDWTKKGMAVWYRMPGREFWEDSAVKQNDGTTLEEQKNDPSSLYAFYKKMIALRKRTPSLADGSASVIKTEDEWVLAFARRLNTPCAVVANLSDTEKSVTLNLSSAGLKNGKHADLVTGSRIDIADAAHFTLKLRPYGAVIIE